jgi:8-hydroxy-5-deazaflavin:NADPH oxidoreductase
MRVGVIGTGLVGRTIAARLVELGHEAGIGTRDVAATLAKSDDWPAPVVGFAEAAAGAELIVNATAGEVSIEALSRAGRENLAGKVLLDISNALEHSKGFPPTLSIGDTDSMGERIQAAFPEARVVKSLNTMNAPLMAWPRTLADGQHTVFVSGNDPEAKRIVTALLREFGHTDILDLGDITTARGPEWLIPLWVRTWQALGTLEFQFKVVR